MTEVEMMKNMSEDVILKIQSFLLGRPEEMRLKNNKKFIELQKLFKINYCYFGIDELTNGDGDLIGLENEYNIIRRKLKLDLLLEQKDRLDKLFDDTYDALMEHEDYDLENHSHHFFFRIRLYVENRFGDTSVLIVDLPYDGEIIDTHTFLLASKNFFEERMEILNIKRIYKICFIIRFNINRDS